MPAHIGFCLFFSLLCSLHLSLLFIPFCCPCTLFSLYFLVSVFYFTLLLIDYTLTFNFITVLGKIYFSMLVFFFLHQISTVQRLFNKSISKHVIRWILIWNFHYTMFDLLSVRPSGQTSHLKRRMFKKKTVLNEKK